jgi:regulatory protein YycI of two-component signal transduction system YycFG
MKWLYIVVILFVAIFGGAIIFQEQNTAKDRREITKYMDSKGTTKKPESWGRGGMGEGI